MRTTRVAYAALAVIVGLLALCLSACKVTEGPPTIAHWPVVADTIAPKTSIPGNGLSSTPAKSTEKPGLLRRLFPASTSPRKFKGTFNYYAPGSTVTTSTIGKKATAAVGDQSTATVTGKKSGPAVIASDSVDQNTAGANAQQTTVSGQGNHVDAKKQDTTLKQGFWNSPAGYAAAAALAGIGGYCLYLVWPLLVAILPKRRKDPAA